MVRETTVWFSEHEAIARLAVAVECVAEADDLVGVASAVEVPGDLTQDARFEAPECCAVVEVDLAQPGVGGDGEPGPIAGDVYDDVEVAAPARTTRRTGLARRTVAWPSGTGAQPVPLLALACRRRSENAAVRAGGRDSQPAREVEVNAVIGRRMAIARKARDAIAGTAAIAVQHRGVGAEELRELVEVAEQRRELERITDHPADHRATMTDLITPLALEHEEADRGAPGDFRDGLRPCVDVADLPAEDLHRCDVSFGDSKSIFRTCVGRRAAAGRRQDIGGVQPPRIEDRKPSAFGGHWGNRPRAVLTRRVRGRAHRAG
jgi:hypothetical protein